MRNLYESRNQPPTTIVLAQKRYYHELQQVRTEIIRTLFRFHIVYVLQRTNFRINYSTMPIKFNKDTSTRLFRYIQTIDVGFNRTCIKLNEFLSFKERFVVSLSKQSPCFSLFVAFATFSNLFSLPKSSRSFTYIAFDQRTRSARELLRQVQAKRYIEANPKLYVMRSPLPFRPKICVTLNLTRSCRNHL